MTPNENTTQYENIKASENITENQALDTQMQETQTPHKRRVRYKGTHPRNFHEKYKEANPEKYADTIEKVISKGSTPAGMHLSIMVEEILEALDIKPGQQGLDATFGYGGHTKAMLQKLEGQGHIYALDVDPIEIVKTRKRLEDQGFGPELLTACQINFAKIDQVAAFAAQKESLEHLQSVSIVEQPQIEQVQIMQAQIQHANTGQAESFGPFDFVLADLGVSSMQIDNPDRGFSYKIDGPLDLRLDPEHGESAAERLQNITKEEFVGMLIDNSDEPFAEEIARVVFGRMRKGIAIDTTTALREAVEEAINQVSEKRIQSVIQSMQKTQDNEKKQEGKKNQGNNKNTQITRTDLAKKSCARVFQALRIDVNSEFEVLYSFLDKLPGILKPGGRVAILTFHSGEDRLVKQSFRQNKKDGIYSEILDDVIRPSAQECQRNPRAKSTKLRWAVRSDKPVS